MMYWLEDGTAVDAAEMLRLTRANLDYLQPEGSVRATVTITALDDGVSAEIAAHATSLPYSA